MITIEQIRAGRALLDWTQADLAKATGLSVRTLNMIERRQVVPRAETMMTIQAALQTEQIVFSADHGVKLLKNRMEMERHEGPAIREILMHDIVKQLRWRGGKCMYMGPDEASFADMNSDILDGFYRDCHRYQLVDLVLVQKGFTQFVSRPSCYRWVEPQILGKLSFSVYHDTVAFLTSGETEQLALIRNQAIADHFRAQFENFWASAQKLPFLARIKDMEEGQWTMARAAEARARVRKMGY